MNNSSNEWGNLKKVVVGSATDARVPEIDYSMRCINYADVHDETQIKSGPYPQTVIDEANEDLETFVDFLKKESVEVHRPIPFSEVRYYDYCPRDIVFIHGTKQLCTPNPIRARYDNWINLSQCLWDTEKDGRFDGNTIDGEYLVQAPRAFDVGDYNTFCIGNPNILACNEEKPMFDAANIIRANNDLLYLVSNSGNKKGAEYLQEQYPDTNVHLLEGVYSYMHIDSTVAFLREGLMLLNPSRIKTLDVLPEPFRNWDVIWCPEPTDIGYHGDYNNASVWINMNLFSVNSKLVALEENQHSLRKELEKHGIECAMLPMRHQRTLGGGFHCVTLDLIREDD